ncbi:type 1 glutamine amidotransferase [Neptuniibacter sp. CAU 1671]|uniref:gamma-glutamyl-gamma-aminobutyrate hydrolase family protein n=1 Tax=Neptuniibacter sp. CAU 1671 TaxID=3032593 RepID=UPI0023DC8DE5|nr:type 1 glutamine amidotransferase [Neptuniibacter sp. CAU 1671]MDF2181150.1 type 1 glutamine amidotransferase [Neptuniibacter sp. CAU 1671]
MRIRRKKTTAAKPLVVVTGPDKRLKLGWWASRLVLSLAGLRACYVTPDHPTLPKAAQGVLITGGDDIDPRHYGLTGDAGANYDARRDALEMALVRRALQEGVPLMGICRGAQLINVVLGGSLFTDIRPLRKLTPNRNSAFPIKWVEIDRASLLVRKLDRHRLKINSLHNQAIEKIARPLRVAAHDRDGFIQAFESQGEPFILGLQWHPEYLFYLPRHRRLFKWFAQAVRNNPSRLSHDSV